MAKITSLGSEPKFSPFYKDWEPGTLFEWKGSILIKPESESKDIEGDEILGIDLTTGGVYVTIKIQEEARLLSYPIKLEN